MHLTPRRAIAYGGLIALAMSLFGCARERPAISVANAHKAYALGLRLAAQDRANVERHRAMLARLMRVTVLSVRDADRAIVINVRIANLSLKRVRSLEMGLEVDRVTGPRLALAELRTAQAVAPRTSVVIRMPVVYARFAEDAGALMGAKGVAKRYALDVKEIEYTDGSDAGYDD